MVVLGETPELLRTALNTPYTPNTPNTPTSLNESNESGFKRN